MRILLISVIQIFSSLIYSQIPNGYYNGMDTLLGNSLKVALHNIIKGHTEFPYTSRTTDLWDILKQTDKDPNDSNKVILFYTGWSVDAAQEWNNGSGWSREHIWSKSRGAFGTSRGAGTDAHHLRPADPSVNSAKNNRWFDTCFNPYLDNGTYTGCFTSSTNWVWQPRDEVKGDVARMIFYMATRYEGGKEEPDLELIDYLPVDNNTSDPVYAKLNTLIQWHNEDSVDNWERNRNDIIYYNFQNNRNPFIDHPEYVGLIWGNYVGISNEESSSNFKIYPNPTNNLIKIEIENYNGSIESELYDFTGKLLETTNHTNLSLADYPSGIYSLKVTYGDRVEEVKVIKN